MNNLVGEYLIYLVYEGDSTLVSIRMATLDGQEVAVIAEHVGSLVSVVPDGSKFAYMSNGSGLVTIKERKTGRFIEMPTPNRFCNGVALSPDGQMVALSCDDIFVSKTGVGDWEKVTNWDEGNRQAGMYFDHPAWSPDGKWLAYSSPAGPLLKNQSGGLYFTDLSCIENLSTCKEKTIMHLATDWALQDPAWSPDNRYLIFKFGPVGAINIWAFGKNRGNIVTLPSSFDSSLISGIACSPDRDKFAFTYMTDIFFIPISGGNPVLAGKKLGYVKAWVIIN